MFSKKVLKGEHVDESGALPIHLASGAVSSSSSRHHSSANRYRQAWDYDKEARAVKRLRIFPAFLIWSSKNSFSARVCTPLSYVTFWLLSHLSCIGFIDPCLPCGILTFRTGRLRVVTRICLPGHASHRHPRRQLAFACSCPGRQPGLVRGADRQRR